MTNEEKMKVIVPWIGSEERITVHFRGAKDLDAHVTGCSDQSADLAIETPIPYMKQRISVPLRLTEVSESLSTSTQDPERPHQRRRLILFIDDKRPLIIY